MSSVRPNLKPDIPKAVTSWDVRTGRSVYWTKDGTWSTAVEEAAVLTGEAADSALAAARGQEALILDPYFMEMTPEGGIAGRETLREAIRATGPTIRRDLGKQAGNP